MADVDVAIGIRRAVVEDEFRLALPRLGEALVKPYVLPAGEQLRLFLRQSAAHRKIRARQEKALGIIGRTFRKPLAARAFRSSLSVHYFPACSHRDNAQSKKKRIPPFLPGERT